MEAERKGGGDDVTTFGGVSLEHGERGKEVGVCEDGMATI